MNASPVQRVHLIFKTHLDLGFTNFARTVAESFFTDYIPRALRVAREMRTDGGTERFVWTTGSWLIYEYLERASPPERAEMEQAIHAGDIAWHGLPFTVHSELMDVELFRFGLQLSQELDRRFGKQTIAAKMTDVPGHTRGIVPLLAEAGIQFLHIGVNAASSAPAVPPVFVWRAPDGPEIMVMYHKESYGGLQIVPGLEQAIAFAHTGDNIGPQNIAQVREAYAQLRQALPGTTIVASTLDVFARELEAVKSQLPVVTQELGDTWIHGVGSDPRKVSAYRALLRLRREWLQQGHIQSDSDAFDKFSRALLKIPEHTWGLDVKNHLLDFETYPSESFRAARGKPNFQKMEASWQEQRAYLDEALAALKDMPLAHQAQRVLKAREPHRPDSIEWTRVSDLSARFETSLWQFGVDARGAIVHLQDKSSGREWAAENQPSGLFCYETFSHADYERYYKQYIVAKPQDEHWAIPDFTKPGLESARAEHRDWYPSLHALYRKRGEGRESFLLEMKMPETAVVAYGCPATVFLTLEFPNDVPGTNDVPIIRFVPEWFDKRACRLPEAIWFSFCPRVETENVVLDKLGQPVSPLDVVENGNRHLHAVGRGVTYRGANGRDLLEIETLDAPLVAPGERSLLNFTNRQPPLQRGMHFLLYDNVWGTNFGMWYQDDARFEFVLRMPAG